MQAIAQPPGAVDAAGDGGLRPSWAGWNLAPRAVPGAGLSLRAGPVRGRGSSTVAGPTIAILVRVEWAYLAAVGTAIGLVLYKLVWDKFGQRPPTV